MHLDRLDDGALCSLRLLEVDIVLARGKYSRLHPATNVPVSTMLSYYIVWTDEDGVII